MKFETTTCIACEHIDILKKYADKYKLPLRTLITVLVQYAAEQVKYKFNAKKRIKYRRRIGSASWKRVHIVLHQQEYEFIMDLRKVWKMSFALIIAYCVENVLEEFVKRVLEKQNTDNYRICNYHFEFGEEEDIKYCLVYWGLPLKILSKMLKIPQNTLLS